MSRDFVVRCGDAAGAECAALRLRSVRDRDDASVFDVDNRGDSLFVTLTVANDVPADAVIRVGDETPIHHFRDMIAFVAIKNGRHNGVGYFADSGNAATTYHPFELRAMPDRIVAAMGG